MSGITVLLLLLDIQTLVNFQWGSEASYLEIPPETEKILEKTSYDDMPFSFQIGIVDPTIRRKTRVFINDDFWRSIFQLSYFPNIKHLYHLS